MKKTAQRMMLKLVGSALVATSLLGCGAISDSASESKVTNGREIDEATYPSVVLLVMNLPEGQAICTGTFVNDSQVITAGHCVEGLTAAAPEMYVVSKKIENGAEKFYAVAKAISYKRNPKYNISLGVSPYDMSVVTFPANSAPATSRFATSAPRSGDSLTIVGYGNNVNSFDANGQLTGEGAGAKRFGSNTVGSVTGGFINFDGIAEADGRTAGTLVSSGSGDSGGPLFVNGKLAGITSGGGLRSSADGSYYATSKYVDVNSSISRSFLATALKSSANR